MCLKTILKTYVILFSRNIHYFMFNVPAPEFGGRPA